MAHLRFEAGVNECLRKLEAPITNGPQFRWQRKQEQRIWREHNPPLSPLPSNRTSTSASPSVKSHRKTPLKPQKSPKKTPKKPLENALSQGDRFIASR